MEQSKTDTLKTTALYDRHCALGAKIVDFGGWKMPVQYRGILSEHKAVRQDVGIFDVSHMGRINIKGPDAEKFLDYISTNIILGKPDNTAIYTVWSNAVGGSVDDVIVYRENSNYCFVVVNAGNRQKDLDHLQRASRQFDVEVIDRYSGEGILSVQGPKATSLISQLFPEALSLLPMHFCKCRHEGEDVILSRTGYTGEVGFEIYASNTVVIALWDRFLGLGTIPVGLGARDTLRLEMGYALYGSELTEQIAANESVSAWTIKWKKENFLGKEALEQIEKSETKRNEYGVILLDPGVARAGYEVFKDNCKIGVVTSGNFSPTLNQAIAIVLVSEKLQENDIVEIQIRQHRARARVTKLPFLKKN